MGATGVQVGVDAEDGTGGTIPQEFTVATSGSKALFVVNLQAVPECFGTVPSQIPLEPTRNT